MDRKHENKRYGKSQNGGALMKFLKFDITNTEPLKITDTGLSRDGEIFSVNYIPGSTLKGAVINALAAELKNKPDVFERVKKELLSSETVFCNSYITDGVHDMFPSPMGFYEDKTSKEGEKELDNVVVKNEFRESYKRARLGSYSFIDSNRLVFFSLNKSDALNINIREKEVYRTDFINAGYRFAGSIGFGDSVSDETRALAEDILKNRELRFGSSRSAGYGKVKIENINYLKDNDYPFSSISITEKGASDKVLYMMLLSPLTMRNENGEICGINEKVLEEKAGCALADHRISRASTSVVKISGINRTWKSRTPEYRMYAAGSVFRLEFESAPDINRLREIEINGLGIAGNDGFGRVVFLADYDRITSKISYSAFAGKQAEIFRTSVVSSETFSADDIKRDMHLIAEGIADIKLKKAADAYIFEKKLDQNTASNSQTGVFRSVLQKFRYSYADAERELKALIIHIEEKEAAEKKHSSSHGSQLKLMKQITDILDMDLISAFSLESTIGGFNVSELIGPEKQGIIKLNLLVRLMIKKNRGGR